MIYEFLFHITSFCVSSFHGLMNSLNWPASSVWVFIAQLLEHCSANAEATVSRLVLSSLVILDGVCLHVSDEDYKLKPAFNAFQRQVPDSSDPLRNILNRLSYCTTTCISVLDIDILDCFRRLQEALSSSFTFVFEPQMLFIHAQRPFTSDRDKFYT